MMLYFVHNFVSAQYLENKIIEFTKFSICIDIDKILVVIVTCHYLQFCKRVMVLELCQNFVSSQLLQIKWTELDQNLYMHQKIKKKKIRYYPFLAEGL